MKINWNELIEWEGQITKTCKDCGKKFTLVSYPERLVTPDRSTLIFTRETDSLITYKCQNCHTHSDWLKVSRKQTVRDEFADKDRKWRHHVLNCPCAKCAEEIDIEVPNEIVSDWEKTVTGIHAFSLPLNESNFNNCFVLEHKVCLKCINNSGCKTFIHEYNPRDKYDDYDSSDDIRDMNGDWGGLYGDEANTGYWNTE